MLPRSTFAHAAGLAAALALLGCGPARAVVVVEPPAPPAIPSVAATLVPVVVVQPAGAPPVASAIGAGCDPTMWWSDGATGRTWDEARARCRELGGELASIHSSEERACAEAVLREVGAPPVGAWIGLHEVEREGDWRWSDGSAASFVPWLAGEPNDDAEGPHDCAHIWSERSGEWNDIPCGRRDVSLLCRMRR
jgi:C-type mannose receptor